MADTDFADLAGSARRILVVRLGAMGDVVRTRFAFAGLRARCPGAHIDWLVEDRNAPGLCGITGLDGVVEVPRRALTAARPVRALGALRGIVSELRERRYDLALDFHSILKSAFLVRASRIPVRIGYGGALAREGAQWLMTHRVELPDPHVSRFERNAALVRFLGGDVPKTPPPLELPEGAADELGELPGEFGVVHPGTSPTTLYKRWEPDRWAEVIRRLYEARGLASVVTWGPVEGEREAAERIVKAAGAGAVLAPRTSGIAAMLALLGRARLFIGSDSGPMHLAAVAGRPIVIVFGPTDPIENAPFPGVPSRVVRRDVGCNPCREGCPVRSCMRAVDAASVAAAALALIAAESAPD